MAANPSVGPWVDLPAAPDPGPGLGGGDADHLRGQPLVLALGIAAAAAISLALTVLGLVRRRRHELALLKTLGMTRPRSGEWWPGQATLTLLIAAVLGGPLGVVAGRRGWRAFAGTGRGPGDPDPRSGRVRPAGRPILAGNLRPPSQPPSPPVPSPPSPSAPKTGPAPGWPRPAGPRSAGASTTKVAEFLEGGPGRAGREGQELLAAVGPAGHLGRGRP